MTAKTNISSHTLVSLTNVSTQVLSQKINRNYLLIQNQGSSKIAIKFGESQNGYEGIILNGYSSHEPVIVPTNAVYLYCQSGTQDVLVVEGLDT